MTQTVPATCVLGPGKTGLTIGLRVLNLDGTTYSAFATTGVAETSTAGTYRKAGGVVAPLAGGHIVWGTAGTDLAEATVESVAVNVTRHGGVAVAAAGADGTIRADLRAWAGDSGKVIVGLPYMIEEGFNTFNWSENSLQKIRDVIGMAAADLDDQLDAILAAPSGLTAQETRDAMKLAPSAGAPAEGSVDKHLDDILEDTGTTLPAQIAICASVVANSSDATAAGAITRRRGNSWSIALTLGAVTGYTSLWFTVKRSYDDADSASVLQIKLNSPSAADGLLYVNGAAATNAALASITVSNAGTGAIVVAVDETITDDLAPGTYYYDAQVLIAGAVTTPDSGTFTVTADVTRSVT